MTRKRNGFLTFIFSLLPGAGEMYMGFFKQGITIMSAFFLLVSLSSWLQLGPLMFILPVLWFYSFFHVHNLSTLRDEEFYSIEDNYLFNYDAEKIQAMFGANKGRKILAIVLIVVGASAIWNILLDMLEGILITFGINMDWYYSIAHNVPQAIFGVAVIVLGVYLIKGKKKELYHDAAVSEENAAFVNEVSIDESQENESNAYTAQENEIQ